MMRTETLIKVSMMPLFSLSITTATGSNHSSITTGQLCSSRRLMCGGRPKAGGG